MLANGVAGLPLPDLGVAGYFFIILVFTYFLNIYVFFIIKRTSGTFVTLKFF